jgi:hypothetical protein
MTGTTVSQSFAEFMAHVVLPARSANPTHERLDGQPTGGNRTTFGSFWHRGRRWAVHADTHYYRLLEAWNAYQRGVTDPFDVVQTPHGEALDLTPVARDRSRQVRPKHLYIYAVN